MPYFARVTDFCSSGLSFDSRAWGPRLEDRANERLPSSLSYPLLVQDKDIKVDVYEKMGSLTAISSFC